MEKRKKPPVGVEPTTCGLQDRRNSHYATEALPEYTQQLVFKGYDWRACYLNYREYRRS